ncbi:perlucin-like protein [Rhinoderma darwinii]|uniref:perlucin-like protein n=1 Tax=Rhinoderma darwinii TaxID=43563 RepID=UPI003F67070C
MNKEVSHLRNHENALIKDDLNDLKNRTDDQQRMVLEDVKAFKKDLENVKQNFLQDIKAINKTLENICRTCPSGWKPIGLFCYYFSTDDLSWDNARDECIRKGAALAFLKNKEEADGLKSYIEQGRYWIGLRRDEEPQKWKWVDGSMLSYSNWHDGEPNNIHVEHCAESKSGKWNDLTCESKLKYACKKWCCC